MRAAPWLVLAGMVLAAGRAQSCSVPVFRYALERWKPSSYTLYVYHRGPLTAEQAATVRSLEQASANVAVQAVDLAGTMTPEAKQLWQRQPRDAALPRVVLCYPDAAGEDEPVCTRALEKKALAGLFDSPVRRQIVEHLARGTSAVWLVLRSGDRQADAAAQRLLEVELARLRKEIRLPDLGGDDSLLRTALPLAVSFAVVHLDRSQAGEADLVRLLLGSDADLERAKGPIVFPIFGRGRLLGGLEGEGLSAGEIETAVRFLCGACSCVVKEQNPGVDLLLTADWDEKLGLNEEARPSAAAPATPRIPEGKPPGEPGVRKEDVPPSRGWLWGAAGAAGVLVVLTGAWAVRRRGPDQSFPSTVSTTQQPR